MAMSSSGMLHTNPELLQRVRHIQNTVCKLVHAFDEITQGLKIFDELQSSQTVPHACAEKISAITTETKTFRDQLSIVLDDVTSTDCPLLLGGMCPRVTARTTIDLRSGENALIQDILKHFTHASVTLRRLLEDEPRLMYLFRPVQRWLEVQDLSFPLLSAPEPTLVPNKSTEFVIDALLITVQNLLAKCQNLTGDSSLIEDDHYIRRHSGFLCELTQLVNLDRVLDQLSDTYPALVALPQDDLQRYLSRLLPFLDRFMELVEEQLSTHSQWMKALCKLDYVLCSVIYSLAKQGFCNPLDQNESESGGDLSEATGGVGVGEGSGIDDISKEIEEEGQVEGLQSDIPDPKQSRDSAEDDTAIEMSEDFGGDLEDVPETDSHVGNESDREDEPDPEDRVEKLDSSDPSAVDEKLWGDQQASSEQTDDRTRQDHSQHKDVDSEVVAKEKPSTKRDPKADQQDPNEQTEQSLLEDNIIDDEEQYPDASGAPLDDYIQDANTLDLPDNMEVGLEEETEEDLGDHGDEDMMDDEQPGPAPEDEANPAEIANQEDHELMVEDQQDQRSALPQNPELDADKVDEDIQGDAAIGQPDISTGQGDSSTNNFPHQHDSRNTATEQVRISSSGGGHDSELQDPSLNPDWYGSFSI
jgi:midasin